MNILHILGASHGGATYGALVLASTSREISEEFRHYALYPGRLGSKPDSRLSTVYEDVRSIPVGWWNYKYNLSLPMQAFVWARNAQVTRFGSHSRHLIRQA